MQTTYDQYVLVKVTDDNNKLPCNYDGRVVDAHDPQYWMSFEKAKQRSEELGMGMGFVLTPNDPFFCLDIDGCIENGQWSPLAAELYHALPGCYTEGSVSGRGVHIWGKLSGPLPPRKIKNTQAGLELYTESRFICLGTYVSGRIDTDATSLLLPIVEKYFKPGEGDNGFIMDWTDAPVPEWSGPDSDEELLNIMLKHRSNAAIFGSKASFQQLWTADADALARHFPSPSGKPYDASSADAAMAQHLAYFTGRNCARMLGFMRSSGLKRDKWDEREDYLPTLIRKCCGRQTAVYNKSSPSVAASGVDEQLTRGFVPPELLPKVFEDCTYIIGENAALVPGGAVVKQDVFKVIYGGRKFSIDEQKSTRNAWEAFTQFPSWAPPMVDGRCFRPELPPLKVVEDNGRLLVNTYIPTFTNRNQGDISPFMKLLETTYPNGQDKELLIAYMAALVQYPGHKFGWAPLLQGPEGNGKTFLTTAIAEAVGAKYSHTANAGEFAKSGTKFNSWLEGKLFVAVHDIRLRTDEEMELLKPLITDEKIEIQGKGRDQYTGDNRANFIFTSNHMDALKIYEGGRRYAPFSAIQQTPHELVQSGLTPQFYADLWDWARGRGAYAGQSSGFSRITHFLYNHKIPDMLNPATILSRAPRTSVWDLFVVSSAGPAEQEILEAVAQGRPGFCSGWISSHMLDLLLNEKRLGKTVPLNVRASMLKRLGYEPHPHLPNGRATQNVNPDGARPRLFAKVGHPICSLTSPVDICNHYTQSNLSASTLSTRKFG